MRRVIIDLENNPPPQDWVDEAERITEQLRAAPDANARKALREQYEGFWRDERIRNWLLSHFNDKCWYSEAYETVSPLHVDHFRPKGNINDGHGNQLGEGYWWLTFEWENYRIAGHLINSKKGDIFPILHGHRANADDPFSLDQECPTLIDPCTLDAGLISFEKEEGLCIAIPAANIDDTDRQKAERTIEILGLNIRDRLNRKRTQRWDECLMKIAEYTGCRTTRRADNLVRLTKKLLTEELRQKTAYEAEFSSVAKACIRKNAPEPLIAELSL